MTSRLRPTLVTMGIALGATLPGCLGQTASNERDAEQDFDPEAPVAPAYEEPTDEAVGSREPSTTPAYGQPASSSDSPEPYGDPIDEPMDAPPLEPIEEPPVEAFFCDFAWPPTKGNPTSPPSDMLCVDEHDECGDDASAPRNCVAVIGEGVCDPVDIFAEVLTCVDGEWQCPDNRVPADYCDGSRNCYDALECRCWGEAEDGFVCGEEGWEEAPTGSD